MSTYSYRSPASVILGTSHTGNICNTDAPEFLYIGRDPGQPVDAVDDPVLLEELTADL